MQAQTGTIFCLFNIFAFQFLPHFFTEAGEIYEAQCCLSGGSNQLVPEAGAPGGPGETVANSHCEPERFWFCFINIQFVGLGCIYAFMHSARCFEHVM